MAKINTGGSVRTGTTTRNGKGLAYFWLRRHHRHVRKVCGETRYPWQGIVIAMHADGVVNTQGEQPSSNVVRQTWLVVLRDLKVEAERRAKASAERHRRSQPPPSPAEAVTSRPGLSLNQNPTPASSHGNTLGSPSSNVGPASSRVGFERPPAKLWKPPLELEVDPTDTYDPMTATLEERDARFKKQLEYVDRHVRNPLVGMVRKLPDSK